MATLGRLTGRIFDLLIQKIMNKVASWKRKISSQGGWLILICHVLSSVVIHTLAVLLIPMVAISKINVILSTFFWMRALAKANRNGGPRKNLTHLLKKDALE